MESPKHHKSREDIQLERMLFFTDGIFAISITLLVIEIKVPALSTHTDKALLDYLSETMLRLFGFLISFGIVGHYWAVHHRIFGYVKKCTPALLWINLAFLLSVVILPFSSGLLAEYASDLNMRVPYVVYVMNMLFTGAMNCWLWQYVSKPKNNMLTHAISRPRIKLGMYRSLTPPLVFTLSMCLSFIFPLTSRFIPLLIPFILHWGMKKLEKRANRQEELQNERAPEVIELHEPHMVS